MFFCSFLPQIRMASSQERVPKFAERKYEKSQTELKANENGGLVRAKQRYLEPYGFVQCLEKKLEEVAYGLFRKVAIYKCTCVCKCLSLSIYFQSDNSFPPVSIYCAYCLFICVQISCCPLRALYWSVN